MKRKGFIYFVIILVLLAVGYYFMFFKTKKSISEGALSVEKKEDTKKDTEKKERPIVFKEVLPLSKQKLEVTPLYSHLKTL